MLNLVVPWGCTTAFMGLMASYFPIILKSQFGFFLLLCDYMSIVKENMPGFLLINWPPFSWMGVILSVSYVLDTCIIVFM